MLQPFGSGIAAACLLVITIGCGAKNQAPGAARLKEAQERVIRAKTRDERAAAQEALRRVQLQEGTGFHSQP